MSVITDLESELRPLRDATRTFLERKASSAEVHRLALSDASLDRSYWEEATQLGWTSLLVPEEAGGGSMTGNPFAELATLADESGRAVAPGPLLPSNVVAWALSRSSAHHASVGAIVDGSAVAAWAFAEGAQWDPAAIEVKAERTTDGFVISGVKRFVESAVDADLFMVTARHDGGIGEFLVKRDSPGVVVTAQHSLDPTRNHGTVTFDKTPVSAADLVDGEGLPGQLTEATYVAAIAIQSAETAGLMQRVFDITLDWAGQRVAFGRVIGSYQAIKHRLAGHFAAVETAAGVSAGLAAAIDAGSTDAVRLASAAKAYIGDAAVILVQDAIQIHGGIGTTWDHDLHLFLRRASTNRVLYGDPAEHRDRLCRLAGV